VDNLREWICEIFGDDVVLADGWDDGIVGIAEGWTRDGECIRAAVYDVDLCVRQMTREDGGTCADAREFLEYNAIGPHAEGVLWLHRRPGCDLHTMEADTRDPCSCDACSP
jgi:hypothetical protein